MPPISLGTSISLVRVTMLPSPSGSTSKIVVASRPPSTRRSTSRVGSTASTTRTIIGSLTPIAVTTQATSPSSDTSILDTESGSVRTCMCGSAIHGQTCSGGAGQRRVTDTRSIV